MSGDGNTAVIEAAPENPATESGVPDSEWDGSPEFWQVNGNPIEAAAYHADRECVSRSQLEDFRKSPALYHGRHVTGIFPPEESPALAFGSAFHSAILEPDSDTGVVVIPEHVLSKSGSRAGAAWEAFRAEHSGKTLMKQAEYEPIARMAESIRNHPRANDLLLAQAGNVECSFRWTCQNTGLRLRARIDKLLNAGFIVDLKTTIDCRPQAFSRAAYEYGYFRQQPFYQQAIEAVAGERLPFVFVVVEKQPPYGCEVFELDEDFAELGRKENARLLDRLAECRASQSWLTPTHGQIVTLSAPNWAASSTLQWELA